MNTYALSATKILILFFITLGPMKLLAPFAAATRPLDDAGLRAFALRAAAVATITLVAGGFIGSFLLTRWRIETPALMLAAGIIFFLVALEMVMQPYNASEAPAAAPTHAPGVIQVVFPMIATPYGIAALITLLNTSEDSTRTLLVLGMLLITMLLDLLTMLYARVILRTIGPAILQSAFGVLSVLIAALAVQIILASLRGLGIVPPVT